MSKYLTVAAAALQVFVLAFMAGQREWVLRTGRTTYLRTAPIDPRDLMRGDYVRLEYEMSRVPRELWRDGLLAADPDRRPIRPDTVVYALLREGDNDRAELVSLSDQRPAEGLFIRGRTESWWSWRDTLQVRYGLEAYVMQQG